MVNDKNFPIKLRTKDSKIRLNYSNKIDSVYCIVGENGSGKTRLLNSILNKDENIIDLSDENGVNRKGYYSFVKFSASVELENSNKLPDNSFDISTSSFLKRMNLESLNREDSINQVKTFIEYYNDVEGSKKWQNLIEISNKELYIKITSGGEGIVKYKKSYFNGNPLRENFDECLEQIRNNIRKFEKHTESKEIINVLITKFIAILTNDILSMLDNDETNYQDNEYNSKITSLFRNINRKKIKPYRNFYKILREILELKRDENIDHKLAAVKRFFNDLEEFIDKRKKSYRIIESDDRERITRIIEMMCSNDPDRWITKEVFSVLEFRWGGLSSGELALLNLLGRLNSVRNQLKDNVIVLIDEVDLGLHPEWQRKWVKNVLPIIGDLMKRRGGSVHVMLTTHSPIILSDFMKEDVIYLSNEGNNNLNKIDINFNTFGQNIYSLFKNSFFLEAFKGGFSHDVIEGLLRIFSNLSNEEIISQKKSFIEFCDTYNIQFPSGKSGVIRIFFEELVNMIGEDIIRNHLKRQIKNARWGDEENVNVDHRKKIEELKEQIKELEEKIKYDKDNKIL